MSDSYVPIDDLAKALSVKVTTVRTWMQKGYIPDGTYIKVGYTYRFNIPAVLDGLRRKPNAAGEYQEGGASPDTTQDETSQNFQFDFDFDAGEDV